MAMVSSDKIQNSVDTQVPPFDSTPPLPDPDPPGLFHNSGLPAKLVFICIVLFLAGIAGGVYISQNNLLAGMKFFTPSPPGQPMPSQYYRKIPDTMPKDTTQSWKTYTNSKVGFEIKYAPDFDAPVISNGQGPTTPTNGSEDNTHIVFIKKAGQTNNRDTMYSLQFIPYKETLQFLMADLSNGQIRFPSTFRNPSSPLIKVKDITVENTNAIVYTYNNPDGSFGDHEVYFVGNNHAFLFNAQNITNITDIDQILSTFKFLN